MKTYTFPCISLLCSLIIGLAFAIMLPGLPVRADVPTAETIASFPFRPGNPSVTPNGDIIISSHPFDKSSTKVFKIFKDGTLCSYPSSTFSEGNRSLIKAVLGIRTDQNGIVWMLDLEKKRFYGWDTKAEKLYKTIDIPRKVLTKTSFLQDFALDQKRYRAIIADTTQSDFKSTPLPAFIVVDLKTGNARRVAQGHSSLMPEKQGGFGLNPITIDPEYEWVYYGAMHGRTLYRVPASAFDLPDIRDKIEEYGPKSYSDGISIDTTGTVYVADIENQAIGITTPNKSYTIIARLPEGQSWPDGMSFGPDGYLYVTVNQLDRSAALNTGTETGEPPFKLVRIKGLAPSSVGR